MDIKAYTSIPTKVSAVQFNSDKDMQKISEWLEEVDKQTNARLVVRRRRVVFVSAILDIELSPSDWIISGLDGIAVVCDAETFISSYKPTLDKGVTEAMLIAARIAISEDIRRFAFVGKYMHACGGRENIAVLGHAYDIAAKENRVASNA